MRCARAWCGSRCAMRGLEDRQSDRCHRRGTSPSAPLQSRRDPSPHNSPARWCWPSWMSSTMLHSWAAEPFSDAAMTTRFCTWCGVSTGCVIASHPKEKPGAEIVRDQASRGGNWPLMPKLGAARSRGLGYGRRPGSSMSPSAQSGATTPLLSPGGVSSLVGCSAQLSTTWAVRARARPGS